MMSKSKIYICCNPSKYYLTISLLYEFVKQALKSSWKEFYDAWTDGCYVSLKFADKSWEIQINKTDESCSFGKGWRVFHEEVGLKEGDYIVAFRERGKGNQQLELCIYRGEDHIYDFETGANVVIS